jgi:hypothetical protein
MFNSKKILPALAIAAIIGAGYTGSALASPYGDVGYLDYAGSYDYTGYTPGTSASSTNYGDYDASILADGNLFEGAIDSYVGGYSAPSHYSAGVAASPTYGQYGYNNYNNTNINQSAAITQAYSSGVNAGTDYIAPQQASTAYNDQFFVGYEYDNDGGYGQPIYQYSDGTSTYNSYFNAGHYESFAKGTIEHNEVLTQQSMGNSIVSDPNALNYNDIDWSNFASGGTGGPIYNNPATGSLDYGNYGNYGNGSSSSGGTSSWLDNINLSYGSGSANTGSGLSQYLTSGIGSSSAATATQSSLSFGTALATPVGNMSKTGFTAAAFSPTLNGLGSIASLDNLSKFYEGFGSADFLNDLPGGMGPQMSGILNDAAGKIGDAAADMGSEFFSSMGDSFGDFDFGDFSMGDFSMGDLDFGMGDMFEGFDLGSIDFIGDFDLGSLTDGLDLGGMFGGVMDGFDLGSIIDTSALTGELTSMISSEISGMVGDMFGDLLGSFDIGGAIGSFFG